MTLKEKFDTLDIEEPLQIGKRGISAIPQRMLPLGEKDALTLEEWCLRACDILNKELQRAELEADPNPYFEQ